MPGSCWNESRSTLTRHFTGETAAARVRAEAPGIGAVSATATASAQTPVRVRLRREVVLVDMVAPFGCIVSLDCPLVASPNARADRHYCAVAPAQEREATSKSAGSMAAARSRNVD